MDFQTFELLSGLISLITLIVFYVLAANVSKIKKQLRGTGNADKFNYRVYLHTGDKEKAYDALLRVYLADLEIETNASGLSVAKARLQGSYELKFQQLGKDFPEDI